MMLGGEAELYRPRAGSLSKASEAIGGTKDASWLVASARPSPIHPKLFAVPSFYDLAETENRLLVSWLLGYVTVDMPFYLAKLLHSEMVQTHYDRVLIDAPPRLSAACIQALCASTHLMIPTVMDQLSTEAVTTFLVEVERLKNGNLCPYIKYGGVIGSMLPGGNTQYYRPATNALRDQLKYAKIQVEVLPEACWIKDLPALGRAAGQTIGILQGSANDKKEIREAFNPLVEEVVRIAPMNRMR